MIGLKGSQGSQVALENILLKVLAGGVGVGGEEKQKDQKLDPNQNLSGLLLTAVVKAGGGGRFTINDQSNTSNILLAAFITSNPVDSFSHRRVSSKEYKLCCPSKVFLCTVQDCRHSLSPIFSFASEHFRCIELIPKIDFYGESVLAIQPGQWSCWSYSSVIGYTLCCISNRS